MKYSQSPTCSKICLMYNISKRQEHFFFGPLQFGCNDDVKSRTNNCAIAQKNRSIVSSIVRWFFFFDKPVMKLRLPNGAILI